MLHQTNILVHVLAGTLGILIGVVAYASNKGRLSHRRAGRLFLGCMAVVILTAINGVVNFVDRPFLAVVTLQAAYLSWTGWRAVRRKAAVLATSDLIATVFTLLFVGRFFWQLQNDKIV